MLLCERGVQSSGTLLAAAQPLARAHLLSHIDRLSQSDGPIDTARIKLRAGRAGRSDSIPSLIGAAQRRRSGYLAARRLGGTFLFPTLHSLLKYGLHSPYVRIGRSDRTLCVVRPTERPAPLLTKTRRWGFRTKLHFFRTAIVLPISALCFLPNPEFKTACAMCSRNTRQRILIFNIYIKRSPTGSQ